ncbi:sialin [Trichonephila clavipes]|nr:sialin [Trichonephila clavipes]
MASTSGVIMPLIVGALTAKEQTLGQWSKVFYISAGINFTSGIIFAMFGSAKLQGWDTLGSEDNSAGVDNEAFDEKSTETCNTKPQETKKGSDMSYIIIDRL